MKAKDLQRGTWYKFFPYRDDRAWHIKHNVNVRSPLAYICEEGKNYNKGGGFDDYSDYPNEYTPSTPEEINKYLPEEEKLVETYQIY